MVYCIVFQQAHMNMDVEIPDTVFQYSDKQKIEIFPCQDNT